MPTLTKRGAAKVKTAPRIKSPFKRFVIFVNPKSSGHYLAQRKIAELVRLFPDTPVTMLETASGGSAAYARLFHTYDSLFGPHTLLCIAAGDGSINLVVEALLLDSSLSARLRRTPITPLWGGNGNDLACILNGRPNRSTMRTIFERATVMPIQTMDFRMSYPDGSVHQRLACVTASFGASAQVARRLNDGTYRQSLLHKVPGGRFLKEGFMAWWTTSVSSTFMSEEADGSRKIYEYTFCNGPRMAKWYRMPVRLEDKEFYLNSMRGKAPVITPAMLMFSFRRRSSAHVVRTEATMKLLDPVWAQFDGEPELIPANTKVAVQLSERPLYVFSMLPASRRGSSATRQQL
jgi:hypothetical protein